MPFVNPKHCPLCHSQDISIDYGMMDNDEDLPPEIEKGLTSFFCWYCSNEWFDELIVKSKQD